MERKKANTFKQRVKEQGKKGNITISKEREAVIRDESSNSQYMGNIK